MKILIVFVLAIAAMAQQQQPPKTIPKQLQEQAKGTPPQLHSTSIPPPPVAVAAMFPATGGHCAANEVSVTAEDKKVWCLRAVPMDIAPGLSTAPSYTKPPK